jgi:hypothetical protein
MSRYTLPRAVESKDHLTVRVLGLDQDWSTVSHRAPYFLHFFIADGYAAIGPIAWLPIRTVETIGLAMNK